MEMIYAGWSKTGNGSYTLTVLVKEENQLYKAKVTAAGRGVLDPEYSYKPMDFCGLDEALVKDLIFRSKGFFTPDLQSQDRSYGYTIQFKENQLQELKACITLDKFEKVDDFKTLESTLYKPTETLKIVERFEVRSRQSKLSLVSVNTQTGEEHYLQTVQPYKGDLS